MDFGQRINEARNTQDASLNTYNNYQRQADDAQGKLSGHLDRHKAFRDIYNEARGQFMNTGEINDARKTYNEARDAVDRIGSTINNLPASITQQFGGTGLNEAQRQRAMQHQLQELNPTMDHVTSNFNNASETYNNLLGRAMQEAQFAATGRSQDQQNITSNLQNLFGTLLGQSNAAYSRYQGDRDATAAQYGARDDWNYKQQALEFERWKANQSMALERWKEQQANARAAADRSANIGLQKYLGSLQSTNQASSQNNNNLERDLAKIYREAQEKANKRNKGGWQDVGPWLGR